MVVTKRIRIVFLVTIKNILGHSLSVDFIEKYCQEVRLCTLRLLTFFVNNKESSSWCRRIVNEVEVGTTEKNHCRFTGTASDNVSVQWAVKFCVFSSQAKCKNFTKLSEVSLENFKRFEDYLITLLECELNFERENGINTTASNNEHKLRVAFREVLNDFQWDVPDIFQSPVRLSRADTKKEKDNERNENTQENFVFLFTQCPKTSNEYESFFGSSLESSGHSAANFLMSKATLCEFQARKIQLNWIDCVGGIENGDGKVIAHSLKKQRIILTY